MAKRKKYNPERRTWRGRSGRCGGKRVRDLKDQFLKLEFKRSCLLIDVVQYDNIRTILC